MGSTRSLRKLLPALLGLIAITAGCRLDMHIQPYYRPFAKSDFFADDRSARMPVEGTVARGDLRDALAKQVNDSVARGAKLCLGGSGPSRDGFYYDATIVADVDDTMPMFTEETFGPAAAIVRARGLEDAIALANDSNYGLGGNLWSGDIERAQHVAARLETGGVFINGMTASDPRLPFGGVKRSGYGRELSSFGIHEFVNIQTVWIGPAKDASKAQASAE